MSVVRTADFQHRADVMDDPWKATLGRLVLPVLVLIAAICTGSLACGLWWALDVVMARDARMLAEQQRFHTESVAAIQRLAENAGMLTSADLCPVRFRLRDASEFGIPAKSPIARLGRINGSGVQNEPQVWMNASGNLEFGLMRPGPYRLSLTMRDGMTLEHEFVVLPGVPVDRVVQTPRRTVGATPRIVLTIDWGEALAREPLIAVCQIDPAPAVIGNWTWQPNPDWQPVYAVATNCPAHPEDLDRFTLQMAATVCPADFLLVPYQYMQLTEIAFLTRQPMSDASADELIELGTVRFRVAGGDTGDLSQVKTSWMTDAPPPCLERWLVNWKVSLPPDVVGELQVRLDRRSAESVADSTAAVSGVLESLGTP